MHFYAGLVYLAALRGKLPILDRLHFRAAAAFVTSRIRTRARFNAADYAHRIVLIDAEQLRNRGKLKRAVPLCEKASRLAQENGWLHEAALVLEKFTDVLHDLGDRDRAHQRASESIALYRHWQAWASTKRRPLRDTIMRFSKSPVGSTARRGESMHTDTLPPASGRRSRILAPLGIFLLLGAAVLNADCGELWRPYLNPTACDPAAGCADTDLGDGQADLALHPPSDAGGANPADAGGANPADAGGANPADAGAANSTDAGGAKTVDAAFSAFPPQTAQ